MVGEDYGVRWLPTYVETDSLEAKLLETFPPVDRMLTSAEHLFFWLSVLCYDTMYVEMGRYLRQMTRDLQIAGGRIEVRKFATPADITALAESLVFNCTGLGSRDLFGDQDLHPARGQLAILEPQPEVDYATISPGGLYMFSRADGVILGGTHDDGEWDTTPDPEVTARILAGHQAVFSRMRCRPKGPRPLLS